MKTLRIALAVLALAAAPAARAIDLVLKLETPTGTIEGESSTPGYEKAITIYDVSFSVEQTALLKEASKVGASAAKAVFDTITFTKIADKSSPALFLNSVLGKTLKKAKISFLVPPTMQGAAPTEYFSITVSRPIISKFELSAANGDQSTTERVSLNFGSIVVSYTPSLGQPIIAGFDLVKNTTITAIPE